MTRPPREDSGDRLSLRALAIASAASAIAALITSQLWAPGTALAAAVTPVIVAIVSELLSRPAEHVSRLRESAQRGVSRGRSGPTVDEPPADEDATDVGPIRRYGRRRFRLKVALVTGALAFVIAAAALTLPELLFGRAATTDRQTTLFGGAPSQEQTEQPTETAPGTTPTEPAEKPPPPTTPTTPRTTPPSARQPRPSQAPRGGQTTSTP